MNATLPPTSALHTPLVNRRFAMVLGASLGLHVLVLVGYAAWDARQVTVLEMPDEPIKATLVRLGKKRDEKLLPRLDTAPLPPPPKPEKAVPVATKEPTPEKAAVPVPTKEEKEHPAAPKEETEARDRSVQSALDRIRDQVEREDEKSRALGRIAERVGKEQDEEEGDEKGSRDGDSLTPSQVNAYLVSMATAVKRQYVVPSVISASDCLHLVALVMVRLDNTGTVVDARIMKGSGEEMFDSAVLQAVKTASPLPAPPPNMREMVAKGFGFKFNCAQ